MSRVGFLNSGTTGSVEPSFGASTMCIRPAGACAVGG
jgi:hypothetical protein